MKKQFEINNARRKFLRNSGHAVIGLAVLGCGPKANAVFLDHGLPDTPNTHNMLLVGEQTAYLSHLPMFDALNSAKTDFTSPHRYQVILEVTFTDGSKNLTDVYTADRKNNPAERMYTFNPALFVLPELDPTGSSPRGMFRGNAVIRGHLERGGKAFIGDFESPPSAGVFDVNVIRVVHFHQFVPNAAKPAQLQYILFGKGPETFMAHFIAQPPDFDQMISVKLTDQTFTDDELGKGINVSFPARTNAANKRLKEKEKASGQVAAAEGNKPLKVEVVREFYFEEGELRVPPTFNTTTEERKARFVG
jgi:hypothetical protein